MGDFVIDVEKGNEKFWQTFWWGKAYATYKKNQIIDVTANISEFGEEMRVRVNFRVKVMNNKGGVVIVRQVDDPEYYQKFFSKVDKGIFIEKEKIWTPEPSTLLLLGLGAVMLRRKR